MAGIFGVLDVRDSDRVYAATIGQQVLYDVAAQYVADQNAALNNAISVFVEGSTTDHTTRYKLPGGGRLQRRSRNSSVANVKATGQWDVAFPIEEFGAAVGGDYVTNAYTTVAELDRHISTVVIQNVNTVRFEMLKALFNATAATFSDELWGDLTIRRLANGDTVTYPPVVGSESDATEDHYLESGYAASAISDTNDPYATMVADLEHHFGGVTNGAEIVTFINSAQAPKTEDLTRFYETPDNFVNPSSTADLPQMPGMMLPGATIGRHGSGTWIQSWDWIPAGYMLAIHMGQPGPLMKRRDPDDTQLPGELTLVAQDQEFPFENSFWAHRFGFGVGNRLNGVVMELGTGGTYTAPTIYQ